MTPISSSSGRSEACRFRTGAIIAVVDNLREWPANWTGYPVCGAIDYLKGESLPRGKLRIINLCAHRTSLSQGYYVSLLAEARGHRVMPTASLLHKLERKRSYREEVEEFEELLQSSLRRIESNEFLLSVYFGENLASTHQRLARFLFNQYRCPFLSFAFRREKGKWQVREVKQLGLQEIPANHLDFVQLQLERILRTKWQKPQATPQPRYSLAILCNPREKLPPSNPSAIRRFVKAATALGVEAEIISPADYSRLMEFDFLLLRETTRLNNHTMRFATRAEREGLIVLDHPDSIRRCCNKVFLEELLKKNGVPTPPTRLLLRNQLKDSAKSTSYPCVLKIPEGSFSLGVYKITTPEELFARATELFKVSDIIVLQAYTPTVFDWRIGVLEGEPLYACRYYMSKDHWQIYNHTASKKADRDGAFDCVPLDQVPPIVLQASLRACQLVGPGIYGVDLKEMDDGSVYVIEVNDNPSIDGGIEDQIEGDAIYHRIIRYFIDQMENRRPSRTTGIAEA